MAKTSDGCSAFLVHEDQIQRVQKQMPPPATIQQIAAMFGMLADPTRARLVFALSKAELCVCDLAALLEMTVSAVSHQLRLLRQMGLVKYRKDGRMAYYSLDDEHAEALLTQALRHVAHAQGRATRLPRQVIREKV
jgi:DNA-binding transcriptional ArsR family regulator